MISVEPMKKRREERANKPAKEQMEGMADE